jgi:DNA-directed RNA polymerase alpha subunit
VTAFQRGEKVRITIDAEIVHVNGTDLHVSYAAHPGLGKERVWIDQRYDDVTVEHLPADPPPMERKPAPDPDVHVSVLDFSTRVLNCLRRWEIHTVAALLNYTADDLCDIRNFGPTALAEVRDVLASHGLELRS